MSLDRIASIVINLAEPPLGLAGFGVPLLGVILTAPQETSWDTIYGAAVDVIEVTPADYVAQLEALGVTSAEDFRVALDDMFAQSRKPALVLIGRRATAVAQISNADIVGTTDGTFTITINGDDAAFVASSSTAADIAAGLVTAVNLLTQPVTAAPGAPDSVDCTADEAGVPFTISVDSTGVPADIVLTTPTPSIGITEDVSTWRGQRDDWYGLLETTRSSGVIETAGNVIEALPVDKIFIAQTNDPLAQTGASTLDIGSVLGATGLNLFRTALWWSSNDDQFVDAAAVGKMFPSAPGSETWANQSLSGVVGISLQAGTLTSESTLANKRYNWLETFQAAGFSMTQGGWMVNGTFTDLIRGRDWLKNLMQTRLVQALRDAPKVPYTDQGAAVIDATMRAVLEEAADVGLVVRDTIVVLVPAADSQDISDKGNRFYPNITFSATLQGAVHTMDVTGALAP